jgi:hypothetical protein
VGPAPAARFRSIAARHTFMIDWLTASGRERDRRTLPASGVRQRYPKGQGMTPGPGPPTQRGQRRRPPAPRAHPTPLPSPRPPAQGRCGGGDGLRGPVRVCASTCRPIPNSAADDPLSLDTHPTYGLTTYLDAHLTDTQGSQNTTTMSNSLKIKELCGEVRKCMAGPV